ncbi:Ubiquinol oxidase 4, chloroplastic/chromoplastic [Tetrabaena socialis]|uniref:Ubiquinol oxidase 4, chloroplastic/chromoplastic n=1 Tax=Tetrabaena socialis TaxID=47790 RepID=A0A2J7ZWY1_9CHLO|nr:Ubiquinol oxidase 4, chloroplastic/chromoplastic [Tetrabaena socialis]|eukprot:PNH04774.1 Ubiquinol oxidase 4, chloroplastic/chromoplastic [Tetrabaena socialis]
MADENENIKPEVINITIKAQDGAEVQFRIKKSTKMGKVYEAYAQKKAMDPAHLNSAMMQKGREPQHTFQTGSRDAPPRRPRCESLLDVFTNVRDDELQHVKTMVACQDNTIALGLTEGAQRRAVGGRRAEEGGAEGAAAKE